MGSAACRCKEAHGATSPDLVVARDVASLLHLERHRGRIDLEGGWLAEVKFEEEEEEEAMQRG